MPTLSASDREVVERELGVLREMMRPAREKPEELTAIISKMLLSFPFGTRHDDGHNALKLSALVDDVEGYPLYAVREACKWWREYGKKEPLPSELIADCKLFCGRGVWKRKPLLERLVQNA